MKKLLLALITTLALASPAAAQSNIFLEGCQFPLEDGLLNVFGELSGYVPLQDSSINVGAITTGDQVGINFTMAVPGTWYSNLPTACQQALIGTDLIVDIMYDVTPGPFVLPNNGQSYTVTGITGSLNQFSAGGIPFDVILTAGQIEDLAEFDQRLFFTVMPRSILGIETNTQQNFDLR